ASLRLVSLGTHFANSEVAHDDFTSEQLRQFLDATDFFVASRRGKILRHAANSGAIFFTPRSHLDMVRPGIALYGIDPTCRVGIDRPLRPAMKWTAPLIAVRDVCAGSTAG